MNNLIEIIKGYLPQDVTVTEDTNIKTDLGLCSLDFMQILIEVEITLKKKFNVERVASVATVKDLWESLEDIQ